jgi:hypothetical protein
VPTLSAGHINHVTFPTFASDLRMSVREGSRMAEAQTHVFRVSLSPKVYRDFEILSAKNLYDLASEIVRVFGFDFDHAVGFYSKLTGDVVEAFPTVGAKMTFLFDYGDNWQFRIEAIGQNRKEPGGKYPRLLKTIGEAPEQYPDPDDE